MARKRRKSSNTETVQNNTDYSQVVDKIKSVNEIDFTLSALIVGRSGTGKTTLACTFPKPILILDFKEEGTDSVRDMGEDVKVLQVTDWNEVEQIYWYLSQGEHDFKTVAWDTVTQAQEIALRKVMENAGKVWGSSMVTRDMWGQCSGLMKTWFFNYRELDLNFVVVAQERIHNVDDEGEEDQIDPQVGPRVMPSVAGTLNPGVKMIGYTFIKEVTQRNNGKLKRSSEFCLRIAPHPYYLTKIRKPKHKGKLPEYLTNASYEDIVKVMKGEWDTKKKSKKKSKKKRKGE